MAAWTAAANRDGKYCRAQNLRPTRRHCYKALSCVGRGGYARRRREFHDRLRRKFGDVVHRNHGAMSAIGAVIHHSQPTNLLEEIWVAHQ